MILLYTLFAKLVPIISVWELKVGEHPFLLNVDEDRREHELWTTNP
jgi:hypothetical protein